MQLFNQLDEYNLQKNANGNDNNNYQTFVKMIAKNVCD